LAGLGFTEIYSYSLVSTKMIEKAAFLPGDCLKLSNPLSADLEYLRPTLLSGVLQTLSDNQSNFSEQKIFELSKVYIKKTVGLPDESLRLTGAVFSSRNKNLFYEVKGVVEFLLKKWGITRYGMRLTDRKCPLWEPGQAVDIYVNHETNRNYTQNQAKTDMVYLGQFGLVSNELAQNFDLDNEVGVFDFDFEKISKLATTIKTYQPIPEFPAATRDLAIVVDQNLTWQRVKDFVAEFNDLIRNVEYLSVYTDKNLRGKKSLALRIEFRADDRTLESAEVDEVIKKLVVGLERKFGAKLR
jgi:phenylalanyl-tRNA synthetase beta chain